MFIPNYGESCPIEEKKHIKLEWLKFDARYFPDHRKVWVYQLLVRKLVKKPEIATKIGDEIMASDLSCWEDVVEACAKYGFTYCDEHLLFWRYDGEEEDNWLRMSSEMFEGRYARMIEFGSKEETFKRFCLRYLPTSTDEERKALYDAGLPDTIEAFVEKVEAMGFVEEVEGHDQFSRARYRSKEEMIRDIEERERNSKEANERRLEERKQIICTIPELVESGKDRQARESLRSILSHARTEDVDRALAAIKERKPKTRQDMLDVLAYAGYTKLDIRGVALLKSDFHMLAMILAPKLRQRERLRAGSQEFSGWSYEQRYEFTKLPGNPQYADAFDKKDSQFVLEFMNNLAKSDDEKKRLLYETAVESCFIEGLECGINPWDMIGPYC